MSLRAPAQKMARKPELPGEFNREASRLGDVGSKDPSFEPQLERDDAKHQLETNLIFCGAQSNEIIRRPICVQRISIKKKP